MAVKIIVVRRTLQLTPDICIIKMQPDMIRCLSCGSRNARLVGKTRGIVDFAGQTVDMPFRDGRLYECRSCHLWFRYPRFSKDELDRLYANVAVGRWALYEVEREDWKIAANWIRALPHGSAVLDVGCFDGQFLEYLGPDYKKSGVEIHSEARCLATKRGVDIIGGNFADLQGLSGRFDAVVAMDVIEHVEAPLSFLGNLSDNVVPGGRIIISTGNTDAWAWRLMGSSYYYCNIGEHISFINSRWLAGAAKHCGLDIVRVDRLSHFDFGVTRRISDLGKNLLYRFLPFIAAYLRRRGFGKKDVQSHPEQMYVPPTWMSANDHLICLLEKPRN